jgi:hypothetical protein
VIIEESLNLLKILKERISMKPIRHVILFILCVISQIGHAAVMDGSIVGSHNQEEIHENVFVKPSQIYFSDNHEIFVLIDDVIMQVNCLYSNQQGIYINMKTGYWVCPRCGGTNDLGDWDCNHCPYTLPR